MREVETLPEKKTLTQNDYKLCGLWMYLAEYQRWRRRRRPGIYLYKLLHAQRVLFLFNRARAGASAAVQVSQVCSHLARFFFFCVGWFSGKAELFLDFFSLSYGRKSKDNQAAAPFLLVTMFLGSREHENYALNFLEPFFFLFSHRVVVEWNDGK